MKVALLGKKIGMTQVFDDANRSVPVTVIEAGPCPVTQVKSTESDGYNAVQIGFRTQKAHRLSRAALGHFKKAGVSPKQHLREVRLTKDDLGKYSQGSSLAVADFFSEVGNRL